MTIFLLLRRKPSVVVVLLHRRKPSIVNVCGGVRISTSSTLVVVVVTNLHMVVDWQGLLIPSNAPFHSPSLSSSRIATVGYRTFPEFKLEKERCGGGELRWRR